MHFFRWFANLGIRYKLFLTYSAALLLTVGSGIVALGPIFGKAIEENVEAELKKSTQLVINMVKTAAAVSIKNHLKAAAESNLQIIGYYHQQYLAGSLTEKDAKEAARSILLEQKIGKTGYIFVWDVSNAPDSIILAVHPNSSAQGSDVSNIDFVQEGAKLGNGYMEYRWRNPREDVPRDKAMYLTSFEPWKWIIAISSYRDEFLDLIDVNDFKDSILSVHLGPSGYCYVIDSSGKLIIHPSIGGYAFDHADDAGKLSLQEICAQKRGKITYHWKNPQESVLREKVVLFDYIPEYDWIVASSSYKDEFNAPLHTFRTVLLVATGLTIVIVMIISFIVGGYINAPLQRLVDAFSSWDASNFSTRLPVKTFDEIGHVTLHFNHFVESLERESAERIAATGALRENERQLRRERALLRALIDSIPDLIFLKDIDLVYLGCNKAFEIYSGMQESELIGKTDLGIAPREIAEFYRQKDREMFSSGKAQRNEEWIPFKDGGGGYFDTLKTPYCGPNGELLGLIGVSRDITERKFSEAERMRLITAVEQVAEGILITDSNWIIQYANSAFERITGYSKTEVIGLNTRLLKSEKHEASFYRQIRATLLREGFWSGRIINKKKDGALYHADVTGSAIRDKFGEITNYVSIHRDVTNEVNLEKELQQAQKMEAIGNMAGGIAHDFNNILAAIMGFTELSLLQVPPDNPVRGNLDRILSAAMRAKDVVKQILTFSRKGEEERKPVAIVPIIREALDFLRSSLPATIKIMHEVAGIDDGGVILADPTRIHQVLINLCTNAAYAMRGRGGTLGVRLSVCSDNLSTGHHDLRTGRHLCLAVSDTGCGMDAAVMERIFDPYFTTKGPGEGTGIGLSVVQGIVKGHGGTIKVESMPGQGTTFLVFLPMLNQTVLSEIKPGGPPATGNARILFVDDEQSLIDLGRDILRSLGYTVTALTNSLEALETFRADPCSFDLVITDMTMPGLTGKELAENLLAIRSDIPIIMCTGFNNHIDERNATQAGISEFLMKPYAIAKLAKTIRGVLDQNQDSPISEKPLNCAGGAVF